MPQAVIDKLLDLPADYVDPTTAPPAEPDAASNSTTIGIIALVLGGLVFVLLAVFYKKQCMKS